MKPIVLPSWEPITIVDTHSPEGEAQSQEESVKQLARFMLHCLPGYVIDNLCDHLAANILYNVPDYNIIDARTRLLTGLYNLADFGIEE